MAWVTRSGETDEVAVAALADSKSVGTRVFGVDSEDNVDGLSKSLSETKLLLSTNGVFSRSLLRENVLPQTQTMAQNFAAEHRIFLRAILDLLTEQDHFVSIERDVNGPDTIKIGSLWKASRRIKGLWKMKYVEIRKGMFSYFDNNAKQRSYRSGGTANVNNGRGLLRKDIPLMASSCRCRAIKIRNVKILLNNSGGFVFELRIQGRSRRLWMAKTCEERQAWILAIHSAMVGTSVTGGDSFLRYQAEHGGEQKKDNTNDVPENPSNRTSLEQYLEVRAATQRATSKNDYLGALSFVRGQTITVPVQWVKLQLEGTTAAASFVETEISSSIEQLWKDLLRDSVEINGEVLAGESFHGPDRILGNLAQQILSSDALTTGFCHNNQSSIWKQTRISEAQAILYARDILLASDRTRSGGDSYFCAENFCINKNLAVLVPSSLEAKPLSIKVAEWQQTGMDNSGITDISGWVSARSSSGKPWKRQYLVLSHCVLSCYAEGDPKPHGLIEQVMIHGTDISHSSHLVQVTKYSGETLADGSIMEYTVKIATKNGCLVREYLFEEEYDFLLWHRSLKKSACSVNKGMHMKTSYSEDGNGLHNQSSDLYVKTLPTVDVLVNVYTEYKMCTIDPTGTENEDTWAELRTAFVQRFCLSGGSNGRILCGDEVVHIQVM